MWQVQASEAVSYAGSDGRNRRGGPKARPRAQLAAPVGVSDVSQRERPSNKRLKLSAPRAPTGGATTARPARRKRCIYRCGGSRRSLSAGR